MARRESVRSEAAAIRELLAKEKAKCAPDGDRRSGLRKALGIAPRVQ